MEKSLSPLANRDLLRRKDESGRIPGILWREKKELLRFLKWTGQMERYARPKPKNV
jgi:hypothetical protein